MPDNVAKRIVLGSGKFYLAEMPETVPADADAIISTFVKPENEFAGVKNGATLTYTPSTYTAEDDLGRFKKTIYTQEVAALALGLMTINSGVISKLVSTGRVSSTASGRQVIKIGGMNNDNGKSYIAIFEHIDKKDGNIYVILCGKNTAELSFAFGKESETVLNPTFTAEPGLDDDGTLIYIVMEEPKADGGE